MIIFLLGLGRRRWALQRLLILVRVLGRSIRFWHPPKKLEVTNSEVFPLEEGEIKACILKLYSLMKAVAVITRDRQA